MRRALGWRMRSTARWLLPSEKQFDLRFITRYQYGAGPGWRVYISRGPSTVCKYFFDAEYGTRMLALRAALAFRDETLKNLPPPRKGGHSSGAGEVRLGRRFYVNTYGERVSYKAYFAWVRANKNVRMAVGTFSVNKYGKDEAQRLAAQCIQRHR